MRLQVIYEWRFEGPEDPGLPCSDDNCEVYDFADALDGVAAEDLVPSVRSRVCLVRTTGNEDVGRRDQSRAYIRPDGTLPDTFGCGAKVPRRYHRELARLQERVGTP